MKLFLRGLFTLLCICGIAFLMVGCINNTGGNNNIGATATTSALKNSNSATVDEQDNKDNGIKRVSTNFVQGAPSAVLSTIGKPFKKFPFVKAVAIDGYYSEDYNSANLYVLNNDPLTKRSMIQQYQVYTDNGLYDDYHIPYYAVDDKPTISGSFFVGGEGCNCQARGMLTATINNHHMLYVVVTPTDEQAKTSPENTQIIEYSLQRGPMYNGYDVKEEGRISLFENVNYKPYGISISPDGKFFYVVSSGSGKSTVVKYPIESDGKLNAARKANVYSTAGRALGPFTIAPNGQFAALFVNALPQGMTSINTIKRFAIDSATGNVRETNSANTKDLEKGLLIPAQLVISPGSKNIYAIFAKGYNSNVMASYDANTMQVEKAKDLVYNDGNKQMPFYPKAISNYIDHTGDSYVVLAGKAGLLTLPGEGNEVVTDQQRLVGKNSPKQLNALVYYANDKPVLASYNFEDINTIYLGMLDTVYPYSHVIPLPNGIAASMNADENTCDPTSVKYDRKTHKLSAKCYIPARDNCDYGYSCRTYYGTLLVPTATEVSENTVMSGKLSCTLNNERKLQYSNSRGDRFSYHPKFECTAS